MRFVILPIVCLLIVVISGCTAPINIPTGPGDETPGPGNESGITSQITDIAKQMLLENLVNSGKVVGIAAPATTAFRRGDTGAFAFGIRNDDEEEDQTFYVHVYIASVSGTLSSLEELAEGVSDWITYVNRVNIAAGETAVKDLVIKIPVNAQKGIYAFRIAVCKGNEGDTLDCHAPDSKAGYIDSSENLYGAESFAIEIIV